MAEKDYEKAQRLNEVYKYLFAHDKVGSQTDFADKLKIQRTGLSAAMNGAKANLTKNLFMKICAAFPNVFNIDHLLTGEGQLLINNEESAEQNTKPSPAQPTVDMLELYAQRIRLVDDLRTTLKEELAEVRTVLGELQQARDEFQETTRLLRKALLGSGEEPRGFIAADGIQSK